mgnify:CR=1 FL=1
MTDFNPYTCRLLRRLDWLLYRVTFRVVVWSGGYLCRLSRAGVLWEARSFFPGWMYSLAAWVQNRWFWTRKILSV